LHQSIVRYKDIPLPQLISDLKWVATSPGLLAVTSPQVSWGLLPDNYFYNCLDWINGIEENPQDLVVFFNSDQQFILGKYFEKLLHFIFKYFEGFSLIITNLQVEKNNRTIGEIDFVFTNLMDRKTTHLEVAVKYYMGYKSSAKHSMWIGPNGMDNLAGKIRKFTTQLSMSAFAEDLNDLEPALFKREVLLKGYFFKHIRSEQLPHFCNSEALTGKWLYVSELDKIIRPYKMYTIVPKRLWLGFYFDEDLEIFSGIEIFQAVYAELNSVGKGILLAELDEGKSQIKTKYMIVPDRWPKITDHRKND